MAARTPEERRQAEDMIRTGSTLWAEFISGFKTPGWREMRDAHCRATAPR